MELITPLVEVGESEEAAPGTFGSVAQIPGLLPSMENYAADEKTYQRVIDELVPLIDWTQRNRAALEEEWSAIRRLEMQVHDEGQRYRGRSNAYLPLFQKALTTRVSALSTGLFPSDEYMDVTSRRDDPEARELAKANKAYIQWEFEKNGKVRLHMKKFLHSHEAYGNAVLKVWYEKKLQRQGRLAAERSITGAAMMAPSFRPYVQCEGLQVSARNIFNVYVYPNTADSLDDAQLVFEVMDVPRSKVEQLGKLERWENVDAALAATTQDRYISNQSQQLIDSAGITADTSSNPGRMGERRILIEAWCFLQLPKSAYMPDEDPNDAVPVRIVLANGIPVSIKRNPFWHQRPPFLFGRANVQPGFFYGYGIGKIVRNLQYLANDFANQTNDCGNYVLNPINKVNPGAIAGPLTPLRPGATWYLTDLQNGQMFDRPPVDLIPAGQQMLSLYMGMLADYSGAPPVLQGAGAGKGARTATGAQILQRNALSPLQDTVEDLELDVMIPLMWMTWMNGQQYREEAVMVEVAGAPIKVEPSQLAIDPELRWLASNQAANQQQRAAQAMQLVTLVAPMVPLLQQQGNVVDLAYMIGRIYSDGFGYRGFDQFIRKMSPEEQMAMQQQAMMAAGAGGAPPGNRDVEGNVRSATEQAEGGGGEIVPGEGEEFANVRDGADQMAAMAGASGGAF